SPQEHQRVGEMIGEMMRTLKPTSFRLRSVRSDGSPFESWVNLFPVYDASGRVNAVGAIGRDITELVRLEHQQALLATIVNASEDVIVGFSLDGRITSW